MFTKAIVCPPSVNFAKGLTTISGAAPDYALALQQHTAYCGALERCGLTLARLEPDERYPDSTFVEDTAVIVGGLPGDQPGTAFAVLARPGAQSRSGEVDRIAQALSQFFAEPVSIREPGTVDGGDICEADDHFFIGVSERTNEAGAEQLAKFVSAFGYTADLIDVRRVKNILHLKSGLAYLGDNRLVVIDELADHEAFRCYDMVRVEPGEQYAANCVRVNDYVLIAAGYPKLENALQELDYQTLPLAMTEFQKMDGGLSCLSLRWR